VDTVLRVLEAATFRRLPKPLVVGGAAFDFDAVVTGTGVSHDLVVVSGPDAETQRRMLLLSGLSRTLDRLQSRRPVSLVLVGLRPDRSVMAELERHARVMVIESEDPTAEEVRSAIAVLLPLRIPVARHVSVEPLDELTAALGSAITNEHRALIDAARIGPDAVREALRTYVDDAAADDEVAGP